MYEAAKETAKTTLDALLSKHYGGLNDVQRNRVVNAMLEDSDAPGARVYYSVMDRLGSDTVETSVARRLRAFAAANPVMFRALSREQIVERRLAAEATDPTKPIAPARKLVIQREVGAMTEGEVADFLDKLDAVPSLPVFEIDSDDVSAAPKVDAPKSADQPRVYHTMSDAALNEILTKEHGYSWLRETPMRMAELREMLRASDRPQVEPAQAINDSDRRALELKGAANWNSRDRMNAQRLGLAVPANAGEVHDRLMQAHRDGDYDAVRADLIRTGKLAPTVADIVITKRERPLKPAAARLAEGRR